MGCSKRRFRTKKAAKAEKRVINQRLRCRQITRVYYCSQCDAWHLTSQTADVRRRVLNFLRKKFRENMQKNP